ncbi:MAG: type IV toxin-antitoxin system AbiEi family antitoxin domain-containing protein [Propionibacteriales bacterium]|nr:type IV toxin-antitoxin system AbiEi family antitoxin domain-containing protein [Propionibacteriales bacterium]
MDLPVEPFTPAMAARAGLGRAELERLLREGRVVRLVRGVYVDASVPLGPLGRARALALVLGRRHLVVDRTAAWLHGAPVLPSDPGTGAGVPLDVAGRRRWPGQEVPVMPGEVMVLGGIRCTTPLRTALDVSRHLAPERALPLLDGLLRAGSLQHVALVRAAAAATGLPGGVRAGELAAIADGRARGATESVLRLHWLDARLPTPVPGWTVAGARLTLGLPLHRFGVLLTDASPVASPGAVRPAGWTVLVVDERRVRRSDPASSAAHLEREFHRHLLAQSGAFTG